MMTALILVAIFTLTKHVRLDPWFNPRYAIRMIGMILGNTMTGVSLDLHTACRQAHCKTDAA